MSPQLKVFVSARTWLIAGILVSVAFIGCSGESDDTRVLRVACAASLQQPVTVLAKRFEDQHDVRIELQFGGTSMLINQAKLAGGIDVLIAADKRSAMQMVEAGMTDRVLPIVRQVPVIATSEQFADLIKDCSDLFEPGVRLGLGDSAATSIGQATVRAMAEDSDRLYDVAVVTRTSVTALATDLQVGSIDAAIVWDSTAMQFHLNAITDERLQTADEEAFACSVIGSSNVVLAEEFCTHLAESDDSANVFAEFKYLAVETRAAWEQQLP